MSRTSLCAQQQSGLGPDMSREGWVNFCEREIILPNLAATNTSGFQPNRLAEMRTDRVTALAGDIQKVHSGHDPKTYVVKLRVDADRNAFDNRNNLISDTKLDRKGVQNYILEVEKLASLEADANRQRALRNLSQQLQLMLPRIFPEQKKAVLPVRPLQQKSKEGTCPAS